MVTQYYENPQKCYYLKLGVQERILYAYNISDWLQHPEIFNNY